MYSKTARSRARDSISGQQQPQQQQDHRYLHQHFFVHSDQQRSEGRVEQQARAQPSAQTVRLHTPVPTSPDLYTSANHAFRQRVSRPTSPDPHTTLEGDRPIPFPIRGDPPETTSRTVPKRAISTCEFDVRLRGLQNESSVWARTRVVLPCATSNHGDRMFSLKDLILRLEGLLWSMNSFNEASLNFLVFSSVVQCLPDVTCTEVIDKHGILIPNIGTLFKLPELSNFSEADLNCFTRACRCPVISESLLVQVCTFNAIGPFGKPAGNVIATQAKHHERPAAYVENVQEVTPRDEYSQSESGSESEISRTDSEPAMLNEDPFYSEDLRRPQGTFQRRLPLGSDAPVWVFLNGGGSKAKRAPDSNGVRLKTLSRLCAGVFVCSDINCSNTVRPQTTLRRNLTLPRYCNACGGLNKLVHVTCQARWNVVTEDDGTITCWHEGVHLHPEPPSNDLTAAQLQQITRILVTNPTLTAAQLEAGFMTSYPNDECFRPAIASIHSKFTDPNAVRAIRKRVLEDAGLPLSLKRLMDLPQQK